MHQEKEVNSIEAIGISRSFSVLGEKRKALLEDICLSIEKGSIVSILGRSGSGKTTLMRILSGLDRPDCGIVRIEEGRIAFIYQDPITAFDPSRSIGKSLSENGGRNRDDALRRTGLYGIDTSRRPNQYSQGQLQRFQMARAFMHMPEILFLDEVTANLDASLSSEIINMVLDMNELYGTTIVMATHQIGYACHISDRIIEIKDGKAIGRNCR